MAAGPSYEFRRVTPSPSPCSRVRRLEPFLVRFLAASPRGGFGFASGAGAVAEELCVAPSPVGPLPPLRWGSGTACAPLGERHASPSLVFACACPSAVAVGCRPPWLVAGMAPAATRPGRALGSLARALATPWGTPLAPKALPFCSFGIAASRV